MKAFIDGGAKLNARTNRGKQGSCAGYGSVTWTIVSMVQNNADLDLLRLYFDNGVEVNCSSSSWSVEFDYETDEVESCSKEYMTLLHHAIAIRNVEIVKLLLEKGADVNRNMIFTHGQIYSISCLQMAREQQSEDIVQLLLEHKASEVGEFSNGRSSLPNFTRWRSPISASDHPGKWAAHTAPDKKKGKMKAKKKMVKTKAVKAVSVEKKKTPKKKVKSPVKPTPAAKKKMISKKKKS